MEEIEYAEMLEIPVSTVNVVRSKRRRNKTPLAEPNAALKESVIASVNDRLQEEEQPLLDAEQEGSLNFDPIPERIDTVRLYSSEDGDELNPYDYPLNEGGTYEMNEKTPKSIRVALGAEFGIACALCCGIFLTNVFMPNSAINTFFRAINTPADIQTTVRPYTDFTLGAVVSELSDAELTLSPSGILSFTDACAVYPAADGKVASVTKDLNGKCTLKIEYTKDFTGVFSGLDTVYYEVGDEVKANVPVGYAGGEEEVQVTMYSGGILLNCFELTEENCLAWTTVE